MQITIINDCRDQNAKLRQISRAGSLFENCSVNCFGVKSDFEAAGFLLDAIDAFEGRKGVIIVNVARREGKGRKWKNGTPFGFFWREKTLIVTSVGGICGSALSLAKKADLLKEFFIMDIPEVLNSVSEKELDDKTKKRIADSQFRSFDFLPRAAFWLSSGRKLPCKKYDLSNIADKKNHIWFIDNFGNVKTTIFENELKINNNEIKLKINGKARKFNFYKRLKDAPDKSIAVVLGSSGIGEKRFAEIVLRGGSAALKLKANTGMEIETDF